MTTCAGFLTVVGLHLLVVLVLAGAPALAALWATRRGGLARLAPALAYGVAAAYTGLEMTPLDRPWMPTVLLVTALLWLPASTRPFGREGRAWLSFAASFAALSVVMTEAFRYDASYCGLV